VEINQDRSIVSSCRAALPHLAEGQSPLLFSSFNDSRRVDYSFIGLADPRCNPLNLPRLIIYCLTPDLGDVL
jgi:hypothetical protein